MASSYSSKHGSQEEKDNKSSQTKSNRNTAGESTPPQSNSDRKETRGGIFSRLGSQSEKSHDLRESIRHNAAQNDADVPPNKKSLKKGNSGRNLEESKGEINGSLDGKIKYSVHQQNSSNSSQKDSKRLIKQLSEREQAAKNEEIARLRKERRKEKKEKKKQLKAMEKELEKDAESAERSNKKIQKSPQNLERSPLAPLETVSKGGNKDKWTNAADESSENKESRRMKGSDRKKENKRERSRSQEKRNEKYKEQKKEHENQQKKNSEGLNKRDLRDKVRYNDKDGGKKDIRDRLNKRDRSRERSTERNRDRDRDRGRDGDRGRDKDRDKDRDRDRDRDGDRGRDRNRDRDWDRDRDRNRSDYQNKNRDRSRERSKERNRDRSNERNENQQDRRSDRYNRDNRGNRDIRDYSDRRYSKPNINLNEGADSSEPESENFLKFPEDENAPKRKDKRPMFKPQYSESKGFFKNPDMTEEDTSSRLAPQKLTFTIDAESVSWKVDTEPQKEEMAVEVEKAVGENQDENSKSLVAANSAKRSGEQRSNKKERSSNQDTDCKSCYKILGQERLFYTRETNLVTKLQDYLMETNLGEQNTKDEVIEEKKEDLDELDEFYSFKNRYFIDNPTMVCRRCRRGGHFERMCPETLSIRCLFCCGQHLTSTCDSFICFRCNGLGHKTKDCTFSGGGSCYKCQKRGHKISQCGVLVSMKKNYNASLEEKREWKQETRCLYCERSNHINCNTKGIATGTEKQVDDLYSKQSLLQIDRETEQLMSGGNSKENALQRGKTEDDPVLIEGSLHSSESDDETPKKNLNRSNTKTNQANSKQKEESQNNPSESGGKERKNKKR